MLVTSTFSNYLPIAAHAIGSTKEGTGLGRSTATASRPVEGYQGTLLQQCKNCCVNVCECKVCVGVGRQWTPVNIT